jgi:hypothetical protein
MVEVNKQAILHNLKTANNCEEVKHFISRSIEILRDKDTDQSHINGYLLKLRDSLERLSSKGFDYVHWCNIRCAILFLKTSYS